ncbi:MAG: hypothetical protein HY401_06115 [Elusimicrobia bacterium]|nr:hypothetical protein [Elusimicrobiota bacterium]
MNKITTALTALLLTTGMTSVQAAKGLYGGGFTAKDGQRLIEIIQRIGEQDPSDGGTKGVFVVDGKLVNSEELGKVFEGSVKKADINVAIYSPNAPQEFGGGPKIGVASLRFRGNVANLKSFNLLNLGAALESAVESRSVPTPEQIPQIKFRGLIANPVSGELSHALRAATSFPRQDFQAGLTYGVNTAVGWSRTLAKQTLKLLVRLSRGTRV